MLDLVKRKKSYIVAIVLAAVGLFYQIDLSFHDLPETLDVFETGWLHPTTYETMKTVLTGGGIAALAAKLNRNMLK